LNQPLTDRSIAGTAGKKEKGKDSEDNSEYNPKTKTAHTGGFGFWGRLSLLQLPEEALLFFKSFKLKIFFHYFFHY